MVARDWDGANRYVAVNPRDQMRLMDGDALAA